MRHATREETEALLLRARHAAAESARARVLLEATKKRAREACRDAEVAAARVRLAAARITAVSRPE